MGPGLYQPLSSEVSYISSDSIGTAQPRPSWKDGMRSRSSGGGIGEGLTSHSQYFNAVGEQQGSIALNTSNSYTLTSALTNN